jgi:hypothetical protein
MVFIPAIGLIGMIPITLGGTGVREGAYILMFASINVDKHQAFALSVLWLGVMAIASLPGGIIYLFKGLRKGEHIPPDVETLEEESLRGNQPLPENTAFQSISEPPKEPVRTI